MQHGYFEQGENARYDAQVARKAEQIRAHHEHVEQKAKLEQRIRVLRDDIDSILEEEAKGKQQVKAMRAELKELEKLLKGSNRTANIQAQAEARAAGEKTYMTGLPCKNGHYARRYTSSGACCECDRIGWKDGKLKETSYT